MKKFRGCHAAAVAKPNRILMWRLFPALLSRSVNSLRYRLLYSRTRKGTEKREVFSYPYHRIQVLRFPVSRRKRAYRSGLQSLENRVSGALGLLPDSRQGYFLLLLFCSCPPYIRQCNRFCARQLFSLPHLARRCVLQFSRLVAHRFQYIATRCRFIIPFLWRHIHPIPPGRLVRNYRKPRRGTLWATSPRAA